MVLSQIFPSTNLLPYAISSMVSAFLFLWKWCHERRVLRILIIDLEEANVASVLPTP